MKELRFDTADRWERFEAWSKKQREDGCAITIGGYYCQPPILLVWYEVERPQNARAK
jgi:hypothetical protein